MNSNEPYVKFFEGAPKIPVKLLQLHEEGKVVFFCGAGISYPAGLPGFHDLTIKIHRKLNHKRSGYEQKLLRAKKYDELLDLLEWNMANGKSSMRQALFDILQPDLSKRTSWETHNALLDLATIHNDQSVHLITTNFDRIFEEAIHKNNQRTVHTYCAPYLPNPRQSSWNGVVYLHGLLPEQRDNEEALKRLVVTSGDFGLAYLKDRWASRFISEVLRHYAICFIGYSLADPVMKYLTDAVAAVKLLGENINPIYMFSGDSPEKETGVDNNKAIQKIYYLAKDKDNHAILHKTLKEWAIIYRDGQNGKERIIDKYASNAPSSTNNADASTSLVLWALQTGGQHILNRFANHNPVPPFEWLELIEKHCCKSYLPEQQWISLGLIDHESSLFRWDPLPTSMGQWLLRYIADSRFLLWVVNSGSRLTPTFKNTILSHLKKYEVKSVDFPHKILKEENSKSDIPISFMIPLWHLMLEDKIISYKKQNDFEYGYHMLSMYLKGKMNPVLLKKLKAFFTPKIELRRPWYDKKDIPLDWELTLESRCTKTIADTLRKEHDSSLHLLLPVLSDVLREGLELLVYLGGNTVDEKTGFTLTIPSIEEHSQNHSHCCELQVLIDLIRDSWLACTKIDSEQAIKIAKNWMSSPFDLFQRLALYAASKDTIIDSSIWLEWLSQNDRLWKLNFSREVLRLLATQVNKLSQSELSYLTERILAGPPEAYFDILNFTDKEKTWYSKRYIWLRLAKIKESGCKMPPKANNAFASLSKENPEWELGPNQREEFSSWCCGIGDPDFEATIEHIFIPETFPELSEWLKNDININNDVLQRHSFDRRDNWQDVCRKVPELVNNALLYLAKQGYWNIPRVDSALEIWRNLGYFEHGNKLLKAILDHASDVSCEILAREIAIYCERAVKDKLIGEDLLLHAADKLYSISYKDCSPEKMNIYENYDPLNISLNHAIGLITLALFTNCFADVITPKEGIDDKYRIRFEKLCDTSVLKFRHGRCALATKAIALYHAKPEWAKKYIVPLFDWSKDKYEASSAWYGFLWHALIYSPLMTDLKKNTLETVLHINQIPAIRKNYISIILGCWFYRVKGYSLNVLKSLWGKFDKDCLLCAAEILAEHQRKTSIKSTDKRFSAKDCWEKDISPIIHLWPHDSKLLIDKIKVQFALIAFYSGEAMNDARNSLQWALGSLVDTDHFLFHIDGNSILSEYPEESLSLIHLLIKHLKWGQDTLKKCLNTLEKAIPSLKRKKTFRELEKLTNIE